MVDRARMQPSPKFTDAVVRMLDARRVGRARRAHLRQPDPRSARCASAPPRAIAAGCTSCVRGGATTITFHVRLACPADSPACTPQAPLPPGDGCGELAWWFDAKAQADREKGHQTYAAKVGAAPLLPDGCRVLLDEK